MYTARVTIYQGKLESRNASVKKGKILMGIVPRPIRSLHQAMTSRNTNDKKRCLWLWINIGRSTWWHMEVLRRKRTTCREVGVVPRDARRPVRTCTQRSSAITSAATRRETCLRLFVQVNGEPPIDPFIHWLIHLLFNHWSLIRIEHFLSNTSFSL